MRICLIALLIVFNSYQLSGQDVIKSVTVNYGGSAYFNFNSIIKYQAGINYTDYTELLVYSKNDDGTGIPPANYGWRLRVKALSSNIASDDGTNFLDLDAFEFTIAISSGSSGSETAVAGSIILSDVYQTIAYGEQISVTETCTVTVSYYCGTTTPLTGKPPGFYFVDLDFLLEQVPISSLP